MGRLLAVKVAAEHLQGLVQVRQLSLHLVLLGKLVAHHLLVLLLLLLEVLHQLRVLRFGLLEPVGSVISEFLNQL